MSRELFKEVIEKRLCTLCGSCLGLCPYVRKYRGKIHIVDTCALNEGRCLSFCPRTGLDLNAISQTVFQTPFRIRPIGEFKDVVRARARDTEIRKGAQHGGTVSSLVCFALERGVIDSAVLTRSEALVPLGTEVSDKAGVLGCQGSSFLGAPSLESLNLALTRNGASRIGFAGRPCQVLALGKRRASRVAKGKSEDHVEHVALTIGLFCTWSLSHDFLGRISRSMTPSRVSKMDIPSKATNVFQLFSQGGDATIPLDEVRPFVLPGCAACMDMTSEFADLSVGVARGMPDWNTVVTRTAKGVQLLKDAEQAGVIEVASLADDSFDNLKRASMNKKRRGLSEVISRTGNNNKDWYLRLSSEEVKTILAAEA